MSTIMTTHNARFTGAFVAECPACHIICAYWEDEDLDENGDLLCHCVERAAEMVPGVDYEPAVCPNCGTDAHTPDELAVCLLEIANRDWRDDAVDWLRVICADQGLDPSTTDAIVGSFTDLIVNHYGDD